MGGELWESEFLGGNERIPNNLAEPNGGNMPFKSHESRNQKGGSKGATLSPTRDKEGRQEAQTYQSDPEMQAL